MINSPRRGHLARVLASPTTALALPPTADAPKASAQPSQAEARLRAMFEQYWGFVWRSLRRLGVADAAADDAAQEVFIVATRRLASIEVGKEKSFLFGVAMRVAADARRSRTRRREEPLDSVPEAIDRAAAADQMVEQQQARALLDRLVGELAEDTRPVFILHELEGLTMAEIAVFLDLPPGTVASRLRRAREDFTQRVATLQKRSAP